MNLYLQLLSLLFSFVYGVLFSVFVKLNYNLLFFSNKYIKIFSNFLFMLDVSFGYFLILKYINSGILHVYFLLLFIFGWYSGYSLLDRFLKK